jgi:uncharacterized protein (TIGR00251 family)
MAVKLNLRIKPNAKVSEVIDEFTNERGELVYKVAIKAPPLEGKANGELIKFLAQTFHVEQKNITIISGNTNVNKVVSIDSKNTQEVLELWRKLLTEKQNPSLF